MSTSDDNKKTYGSMLFLGYFMMLFISMFIIGGIGDWFTNLIWFILMYIFAISGIYYGAKERESRDVVEMVEEIE